MNASNQDFLRAKLNEEQFANLEAKLESVAQSPKNIIRIFPSAAREIARGPADANDPAGIAGPTIDDAVRAALLVRYAESFPENLAQEIRALYEYGDTEEKRAILRALDQLPAGAEPHFLVQDALRTNDRRLIAAAMGTWSQHNLPEEEWRQGILKCLFVGVSLDAIPGCESRNDRQMARMAAGYAHELLLAGRSIPSDIRALVEPYADVVEDYPELTMSDL